MMVMTMKMMVKKIVIGNNDDDNDLDDDDSDDTDGDDTGDDDDDDDDNVTLGIPEAQKSPSMAWKNFMPFYNSHRSVNLPSYVLPPFFFFLFPLSKIKWELHELFEREI